MTAPTKSRIVDGWNRAAVVAAAIGAVVAGFILPPPHVGGGDDVWLSLGRFLVAVLVLLLAIPVGAWNAKRHGRRWAAITLAGVVLGLTMLLWYQRVVERWTVPYGGGRVVHGSVMHPRAIDFRAREQAANRTVTDSALVFMAGGLTDRVWDNSDRLENNQIIALIYLGLVTTFATVLVSATQVAYCARRRR